MTCIVTADGSHPSQLALSRSETNSAPHPVARSLRETPPTYAGFDIGTGNGGSLRRPGCSWALLMGEAALAERRRSTAAAARDAAVSEFKRDWRRLNTGRLLYECFELYNAAVLKSLKSTEFSGVRNTHFNLLRHLDAEGTRMSDLADRANFTKAAITSLVRACSELDLVSVAQSAGDARERVVKFSPKGLDLMRHIRRSQLTIERRLAAHLDDDAYAQLRAALLSLSSLTSLL